jgi:hypothetical protein
MAGRRLGMALAAIGSLAPMTAYAQTDQKIVLSCTVQMGSSEVVNLDLAAKTVSVRRTVPPIQGQGPYTFSYQGAITQATEQQIDWTDDGGMGNATETLDRYTGVLMVTNAAGTAGPFPCQRQQKQF